MKRLITFLMYLACAGAAFAQNAPLIMPIPEQQFLTATGTVCSGCFVYTYVSGTTTPLSTYTDYTGLFPNTNPVRLNAGGYPQTASGAQVGIWLQPTATYRIVLQNSAHIQLWQIDGITGQIPNTLSGPLFITDPLCNQLIFGTAPNQTSFCVPAPAGNITLNFPNTASDTLVGRNTTDTLVNKTLTSPVVNTPTESNPTINGVQITQVPAPFLAIPNSNPGTVIWNLTKLVGAASATISGTADTGAIIGVCTQNCGIVGNAIVQQEGLVFCSFDNATTALDLVGISSTVGGACHDTGIMPPASVNSGQVVGQVLSTNSGPGTYEILLTPIFNPVLTKSFHITGVSVTGAGHQFTATWSGGPFLDTNYTANCTLWSSTPAVPGPIHRDFVLGFDSKTAAAVNVWLITLDAVTDTVNVDCVAIHD